MIAYSRDEMVSVTDLLKSLRQTLDKISHQTVEKVAVMKNNRPEAVMLSVEEYERIKELADMAEHIGLAEFIRERKATPKASYIPFEDVMAKAKEDFLIALNQVPSNEPYEDDKL
jgi:PHD/YefM family antitoxin component YafN of YafNO toxin-antitoxin module